MLETVRINILIFNFSLITEKGLKMNIYEIMMIGT